MLHSSWGGSLRLFLGALLLFGSACDTGAGAASSSKPPPAPDKLPSPAERFRQEFGEAYPSSAPPPAPGGTSPPAYVLEAAQAEVVVAGRPLFVWAYNQSVPGPTLRGRVGQPMQVTLHNNLPQPTTIHWHGVRVPNAMDGVPGVTQPPVQPGESFVYRFTPKDAGTFWFHPHVRGSEQVERGLFGVLIVEDAQPLPYTADVVWVLDDVKLAADGQIDPRFVTRHDLAHDGRWGNTISINGKASEELAAPAGGRLRLRLVVTANGRVFAPDFGGLDARVIAVDGMYASKPLPADGWELAPGNRLDIDISLTGTSPGTTFEVLDRFTRQPHKLGTIRVVGPAIIEPVFPSPAHASVPGWKGAGVVPPNLTYRLNARRGGPYGLEWTLDGNAYPAGDRKSLRLDEWSKIRFVNESARLHPMHIHGQFFKLLKRNGKIVDEPFWRDTVLTHGRETIEVGIVPLDEGSWMLHCHILEHAEAGMMTVLEVRK